MKYIVTGDGINQFQYQDKNQPIHNTIEEANDYLFIHARKLNQSWLCFWVEPLND